MSRRSPTFEGFSVAFRQPSFGLAEIAWRWSFGFAACALLAFSFFEYLDTLPVTPADVLLLQTGRPALISWAVRDILHGSSWRVVEAVIVLLVALAVAWTVVGSLARAATLRALLAYFRNQADAGGDREETKHWSMGSLFGLNFFRVAVTVAAAVGCFAPFLFSSAILSPDHVAPGAVLLIILIGISLVGMAWSAVNWFLSLAAIFVVSDRQDTFGALGAAADLCRSRSAEVFGVGTWFGLARLGAFAVASSVVVLPLAFAAVAPMAFVWGGMLLITLLYFAIADFFYVGRLAAYVAIIAAPPELPVAVQTAQPPSSGNQNSTFGVPPVETIDRDELILSDRPAEKPQ